MPADTEYIGARTNIRSFSTTALACLAVLVLAASASAKGGPPAGKGGPPPWAGGGKSAHKAQGAAKKADKAVAKAARKVRKAAEKAERARESGELNPAMTCFGRLAEMGEGFYEHYGTNPNNANAFGKCVSEQAHAKGEDGTEEPADVEPDESADCEEHAEGDEPADDPAAEPTAFEAYDLAEADCEPAEDEPGDSEEADFDRDAEAAPPLACFGPAAARTNPFALCVTV